MPSGIRETNILVIIMIVTIGGLIYSNTFTVPFYFDDINNIQNPALRIENLSLENLKRVISSATLSTRPTSNLSFAINYYFGGYRVQGYHLVNICIHLLSGIFIYLLLNCTLTLSINKYQYSRSHLIAFFTSLIWIVNPVATQSVTYIVQRMNSMATMFFILALLYYVLGRLKQIHSKDNLSTWPAWVYFLFSIIAGALAIGSKEIAITLPIVLMLYEWYFFQDLSTDWLKTKMLWLTGIFFLILLIVFQFLGVSISDILASSCNGRDFTAYERLLTQTRVVIYYISLLFYPSPDRLALEYNYPISTSLLDPFSTLLSTATIAFLLILAFYYAKRERLLSFCILGYFLTLVVESSVICLEMVFEHRTYLPSIFLFLFAVASIFRFFNNTNLIKGLFISICICFSYWTYERNNTWRDPIIFWSDAIHKTPNKARAHDNLGLALMAANRLDEAEQHLLLALKLDSSSAIPFNNIGALYARAGRLTEAAQYYKQALNLNPKYYNSLLGLSRIQKSYHLYNETLVTLHTILSIFPEDIFANKNIGNILLRDNKPEKALPYLEKAYSKDMKDREILLDLGESYLRTKRFAEADEKYHEVLDIDSESIPAHYNLALLSIQQGEYSQALDHYEKAVLMKGSSPPISYNYANLLLRTGEVGEAQRIYEKFLNENIIMSDVYNNLGLVMLKSQKYNDAADNFRKSLCIKPDSKLARENLRLTLQLIGSPEEKDTSLKSN